MRRPHTLAEVSSWSEDRRTFHRHLADFLDQFYLDRSPQMLGEEPGLLVEVFDGGAVADAYLAATAVSLARDLGCVPPAWTRSKSRSLPFPWFASEGDAIRATLLAESPAPFRERNLFVSANALSRA